ncbi:MAG: TlpA disulfide reductase family protein [Lentimicrobiaceae bacterium]|nr:TlpA disulfide reductase family protein [Lentimicrobiaceae bacterium]
MRKKIIILAYLFATQILVIGQNKNYIYEYSKNIIEKEFLSYDITVKKLNLLENDTTAKSAKVQLVKNGNKVAFFRINDISNNIEYILKNDSIWQIVHKEKQIRYIGGRNDVAGYGAIIDFFPIGSIFFDTTVVKYYGQDSYKKIGSNGRNVLLKHNSQSFPEMIEDIDYVTYLDTINNVIDRYYLQIKYINNIGMQFQGYTFSNYSFEPINTNYYYPYEIIYEERQDEIVVISDNTQISSDVFIDFKDVTFMDINKNKVVLPKQGYVFVDVWYAGCMPCMRAAPIVEKLYEKYKDRIAFYSINEVDDDVEKIKKFADKMHVTMPIVIPSKRGFFKNISDKGYPIFVLYNASDNKIISIINGYNDNLEKDLEELLLKI